MDGMLLASVEEERSQNGGQIKCREAAKSSAPEEQLYFINVADPLAVNSMASKKVVRSYAARATHRNIRRFRIIDFEKSKRAEIQSETTSNQSQVKGREGVLGKLSQPYTSALNTSTAPTYMMARPIYGPVDGLSSRHGDPFQSLAIQLSPFEQYLLDHFVRFVIPQSAAYYPRSKHEPSYQDGMILHLVPFAVTDQGVMNGLFFSSCRSLAILYKNDFYLRDAFKYNEKCIRSVSEAISEEVAAVTDSTMAKVLLLSAAEFHAGNIGGTRNHANAIGEMVRLRGGLQNLGVGGFLRQLVLWHDRTSTSYIGTSTNFMHMATFEENASIESLSPGFLKRLDSMQLSIDMINILNDVCAYTNVVNSLCRSWSKSDHINLSSAANELEVRLLVLSSDYQNPSSSRVYSQIEEGLFLSLRVFMRLMPHESSFPPRGCKHLAARINSVLSQIMLLPSWYYYADLLLWMAFMGSIAAQAGKVKEENLRDLFTGLRKQVDFPTQFEGGTGDEVSFWVLKLVQISSFLSVSSKEDAKAHLERFLYVEVLCEAYSLDMWSDFETMVVALNYSM